MSRTDNTDPYWVTSLWWTPTHFRCQYSIGDHFGYSWLKRSRDCDLPPYPIVSRDRPRFSRWRNDLHCIWEPQWPRFPRRYKHTISVPKWFRDHRWFNPERVRVRDSALDMIKDYRANGHIEMEFQNFDHHNSGQWDWD